MPVLPGPYEILEMTDGQKLDLQVIGSLQGQMTISPLYKGAPPQKTVDAIRLFVDPPTKPTGAPYYDATSGTLVLQLRTILATQPGGAAHLVITKVGTGPSGRYQVQLVSGQTSTS